MKIIIITGEPFPNGMAATNRIKCYAQAIHENGVKCEVLIYRRTEVFGKKPINIEGCGSFKNIPFRYIGGTPLRGSNVLVRRINDKLDEKRIDKYLKHNLQKGDVLFFFMGGNVDLMLRYIKIAHTKGAFCVRDLCELPCGTGAETELSIRQRKRTIEKAFPFFDGIISISNALYNLARAYTTYSCKHIIVPIMVDYEHYGIETKPLPQEHPYIFHAGTLYQQKDGILGMIEAFGMAIQRLRTPVKYVLTSSINASPHTKEIAYLIDKYHIKDSIEFVGYLNSEQVKEYLSKASLVISNRPKSKQDYYGFSTKIGEYLASGTPLITTRWGEAVNWLNDGESAYIIEPEDTEALANTIVYVFNNYEEAKKVGLKGKEVCRKSFDYRNWSKSLVEFFNQLGK